MKAELKPDGTSCAAHIFGIPAFTHPLNTSWGDRVELQESTPGSKTRQAFVFVRTYEQSRYWVEVFVRVRVPSGIPDRNAAILAANKAHARAVGYSWVMWARKRIMEKYSSLQDVEEFTQALRNLSAEWCPRTSEEGRSYIEKVLNLGCFASSAYPENITTATP